MELEEEKVQGESIGEVKKSFTLSKVQALIKHMNYPELEEQRARDLKTMIRSVKEVDLVVGAKTEVVEEEDIASRGKSSSIGKKKTHVEEMPSESIKKKERSVEDAFLECLGGPREPSLSCTESEETTNENISEGRQSDDYSSQMSDQVWDRRGKKEKVGERGVSSKKVLVLLPDANKVVEPAKPKKPKKWKPKLKGKPLKPDPLFTEYIDGVTGYLRQIGVNQLMRNYLVHIFGMSKKPANPVEDLRKYLEHVLGNALEETGLTQLENELRVMTKKEDVMRVEISKLKHLTHLLAPEIYDANGGMIVPEPSIGEEEFLDEELLEAEPMSDLSVVPSKLRKGRRVSKTKIVTKKTKIVKKADVEEVESKTSGKSKGKNERAKRKKILKQSTSKIVH